MSQDHVVINGETYVVSKLKTLAGSHDETVDRDLLVQHENPIAHPHIVARKYDGKYQIILGCVPEQILSKLVKIKVISSVTLKKARYQEITENFIVPETNVKPDFRNNPRIRTSNKTRDYQGNKHY